MEIRKHFYSNLTRDSKKIFYIKQDKVFTYEDLWKLVKSARTYLKNNNINSNERVAIYCEDSLNFIVSLLAVISIGACGVLIEEGKKEFEIQEILDQINNNVIVTDSMKISKFGNIDIKQISFNVSDLSEDVSNEVDIEEPEDMNKEAYIIYTSGSNGKPKGVIRTREMVFKHASILSELYEFDENDSILFLVKLQHAYGIEHIFASICGRAKNYIFDEFLYHKVINFINENMCTAIIGVPYQYQLLSKFNLDEKARSLRLLTSAGAPLPEKVNRKIYENWGLAISQVYGSSELAASAVNLSGRKFNSVGKAIKGVKVKIVDDDGGLVKHGEIGELVISSPFCTKLYVNKNEPVAFMDKQWFYTGDFVYIDTEGDLFITGRKKNIINIAGKKVSPEEVEMVIKSYKGIEDVKVEGESHPLYGEVVSATIVTENRQKLNEIELIKYCKKFITDYKVPSNIYYTDKLQLTGNGKIKR